MHKSRQVLWCCCHVHQNRVLVQCRLLRSAIGNFPGQKVTCPVIFSVGLTECPDDPHPIRSSKRASMTRVMNNTNVRMRARAPVRPHPFYLVVKESNMKRGCEATESDDLGPNKKPRRRQVTLTTFKKWQVQLEREHQMMTWLRTRITPLSSIRCGAMHAEWTRLR